MRSRTSGENTVLASEFRWYSLKLEIKDAFGSWVDWVGYTQAVTWGSDIDTPIVELRIRMRRDNGPDDSLSPFRGDSPLNSGGAAIDAGRAVRLSVATTEHGVAPAGGDYKLLFLGTIDSIDFGQSTMEIVARDQGGALVDAWIEEKSTYGAASMPLQDAMQDILDDWAPSVTLYVPVDPGFLLAAEFPQEKSSVWDALRALAGLIGWDLRYIWDDGTSAFRLTLLEPDRTKTTPDWTFAGDRYHDINRLSISRELVRNYIVVTFFNESTGLRESVFATDATSVARFGRRWMEIEEASDSPISTTVEAQALADAALSDLAWPVADKQATMPFFWALEIGDLLRFTANFVHSDEDLDLAVTGLQHELSVDASGKATYRTVPQLRGKPSGFYKDWIRRSLPHGRGAIDPPSDLALTSDDTTALATQDGQFVPQIKVEWTASPGPNLDHYEVRYKITADDEWTAAPNVPKDRTATFLQPVTDGENHTVQVRAVSKGNARSTWLSGTVDVSTQGSTPPETIGVVTGVFVEGGSNGTNDTPESAQATNLVSWTAVGPPLSYVMLFSYYSTEDEFGGVPTAFDAQGPFTLTEDDVVVYLDGYKVGSGDKYWTFNHLVQVYDSGDNPIASAWGNPMPRLLTVTI